MTNKKYTFEDWLEGNIPEPPNEDNVNILNYWTYISEPARIDESEFQRIRSQQKKAFFDLVDRHVEKLVSTFIFECAELSSDGQTEFLKIEMMNVNEKLKDYELLKKIKLRQWDPNAITPIVYKNHMQLNYFPRKGEKSEHGSQISFPSKQEDVFGGIFYSEDPSIAERSGETIPNLGKLHKAYVYFNFMRELELLSILIPLDNDSPKEKITGVSLTEEEASDSLSKNKINPAHDKYKNLLDSAESIPAGKFDLVNYVQNEFDLRTQEMAFNKANEIHFEIYGKNLYKSFSVYEVSKSKYYKQKRS